MLSSAIEKLSRPMSELFSLTPMMFQPKEGRGMLSALSNLSFLIMERVFTNSDATKKLLRPMSELFNLTPMMLQSREKKRMRFTNPWSQDSLRKHIL
jgi:hypothetical protein